MRQASLSNNYSHRSLGFRLTAVKLASLNVCSMTPNNSLSEVYRFDDRPVGEPDRAPAAAVSGYQGAEAKIMAGQQALHVVMVHFLTSNAI